MRSGEIAYINFMESICNKYNAIPAFSCLKEGFIAFCESQNLMNRFKDDDQFDWMTMTGFKDDDPMSLDWMKWINDCVDIWNREWKWDNGKRVPRYTKEQISYWRDKAIELYRYYMSLYSEYIQSNPSILDDNNDVDWELPLDYIANGTYPDGDEQEFLQAKELITKFVEKVAHREII